MKPIIRVENLGKQYRIGRRAAPYATLRESLVQAAVSPINRLRRALDRNGNGSADSETHIWALKDVSFEVKPGEVVGIIGRNGAGKSTLLKILSRVTEPTEGKVDLYGRVGSLLEVGTGFHPELTGRENIYLNGAILGMKRRELDRKFDTIIAFAELDRLLDTPVKRYSSGMFVRLAFAVASHLEPEILIIDEVLAVGDSAFQKKCLKRIEEVADTGKTVLLVTHNLSMAVQMCSRAFLLKGGSLVTHGPVGEVVRNYQYECHNNQEEVLNLGWCQRRNSPLGGAKFLACRLTSPNKEGMWILPYGIPIEMEIVIAVERSMSDFELGFSLCMATGYEAASSLSIDAMDSRPIEPGPYVYRVKLPSLKLAPGSYYFGLGLRSERGMEDYIPVAVHFDISPTVESAATFVHLRRGPIVPELCCELIRAKN